MKISVVVPCYKTAASLPELHRRLQEVFFSLELAYQLVLVDDRSPQDDWRQILALAAADANVVGIRLARNFGQHTAITAGVDAAIGDWVVVMDADLQDMPEEIPRLLAKAREGWNAVRGRRAVRQDRGMKRLSSRMYHGVFSLLSGRRTDPGISNFGIYDRKLIEAFKLHRERYRGFRTFVDYMGFERTSIDVSHGRRAEGRSAYTFRRSLNLALENLLAFSDKPLRAMASLGLFMSLVSFLFALGFLLRAAMGKVAVLGWASLIVSLWFLGSLNIFLLGLVGLYLGRVFEQVKNRPLYLVDERIGLGNS